MAEKKITDIRNEARSMAINSVMAGEASLTQTGTSTYVVETNPDGVDVPVYVEVKFTVKNHLAGQKTAQFVLDDAVAKFADEQAERERKAQESADKKAAEAAKREARKAAKAELDAEANEAE